jgi:hypothetical protein
MCVCVSVGPGGVGGGGGTAQHRVVVRLNCFVYIASQLGIRNLFGWCVRIFSRYQSLSPLP